MKHRIKINGKKGKTKTEKQHKYYNNNNIIDKEGFLEIP
jgi:hypothetical protein